MKRHAKIKTLALLLQSTFVLSVENGVQQLTVSDDIVSPTTKCLYPKPRIKVVEMLISVKKQRLSQLHRKPILLLTSSGVGDVQMCLTIAETYTLMALESITTNTVKRCNLGLGAATIWHLGRETTLYVRCIKPTLLLFWRIIARVLCSLCTIIPSPTM